MSDVVVDSCVVAKWFLIEPDTIQANQLMADVTDKGGRLVVLDLVLSEVVNAIWKRCHRGIMTLDEARRAIDDLLACPVHLEPARAVLKPGFEIAAKYHRSGYDALFVALARHLGLRGVTSDEPLYNAVHADFPEIILLRNWPPAGSP
jgi:predicted nucleic acid-binding protein